MRFEFATATRILFGPGTVQEVASLAPGMGKRAFVVTGRSAERAAPLLESLKEHRVESVLANVPGEPTTDLALAGVERARETQCDFVIGIGGGSVLDTGKPPTSRFPPRLARARRSHVTLCWPHRSISLRSACAVRRCFPAWPWWILS
jgi:hypothetical protein